MGASDVRGANQQVLTDFPDLQVLVDDILVQGDPAGYRWTLIGTITGPGGTGQRVRVSGFESD